MKVLVLGAGVAGVAAAYYLWRDGHEVVVADRQLPPRARPASATRAGCAPASPGPGPHRA
ncbi:FAD-dependent oxidoreductase [Achromobacter xylosoxidans]